MDDKIFKIILLYIMGLREYNLNSNELILVLGGPDEREETIFDYALDNFNTFIMLSSGQNPSILNLLNNESNDNYYNNLNAIKKEKLNKYWEKCKNNSNKKNFLNNYEAKDTLENFITMTKGIKIYMNHNLKIKKIFIYTSQHHINRSLCIANYIFKPNNIEYQFIKFDNIMNKIFVSYNYKIELFDLQGNFSKYRAILISKDIDLFEKLLDKFNLLRGDTRYEIRQNNLKNSKSLSDSTN